MPDRDALIEIVEAAVAEADERGVVQINEAMLRDLIARFRSMAAHADAWREAARRHGCEDMYPGPVELQRQLYIDR